MKFAFGFLWQPWRSKTAKISSVSRGFSGVIAPTPAINDSVNLLLVELSKLPKGLRIFLLPKRRYSPPPRNSTACATSFTLRFATCVPKPAAKVLTELLICCGMLVTRTVPQARALAPKNGSRCFWKGRGVLTVRSKKYRCTLFAELAPACSRPTMALKTRRAV